VVGRRAGRLGRGSAGRRAAIHHALLSYLFGAVILAVAINTVATLLGN
jgi:uncharacterized membrane protein